MHHHYCVFQIGDLSLSDRLVTVGRNRKRIRKKGNCLRESSVLSILDNVNVYVCFHLCFKRVLSFFSIHQKRQLTCVDNCYESRKSLEAGFKFEIKKMLNSIQSTYHSLLALMANGQCNRLTLIKIKSMIMLNTLLQIITYVIE